MTDEGVSLRSILKKRFDTDLTCKVINTFTSMQLNIASNITPLIEIGVPDWRLENFSNLYQQLISYRSLLLNNGLSDIEINQLHDLIGKVHLLIA